jgi:hypothetical protein
MQVISVCRTWLLMIQAAAKLTAWLSPRYLRIGCSSTTRAVTTCTSRGLLCRQHCLCMRMRWRGTRLATHTCLVVFHTLFASRLQRPQHIVAILWLGQSASQAVLELSPGAVCSLARHADVFAVCLLTGVWAHLPFGQVGGRAQGGIQPGGRGGQAGREGGWVGDREVMREAGKQGREGGREEGREERGGREAGRSLGSCCGMRWCSCWHCELCCGCG